MGAVRLNSVETAADPLGDSGSRTPGLWAGGPSPDDSARNHRFVIAV